MDDERRAAILAEARTTLADLKRDIAAGFPRAIEPRRMIERSSQDDNLDVIRSEPVFTERSIEQPETVPDDYWLDSVAGFVSVYVHERLEPHAAAIRDLRLEVSRLKMLRKKIVTGAFDEVRRDVAKLAAQVSRLDGRVDTLLRMDGGTAAKRVKDTSGAVIDWRSVRARRVT